MRLIHSIFLGVCSFILSGCLTVTRGTTEELKVITSPPGASVEAVLLLQNGQLDNSSQKKSRRLTCNSTPCSVIIPRNKHARVSIAKDGYQGIKFLTISKGSSPTSSIRPGTIVAGVPPGSHVIAGSPETLTRFVSGNTLTAAQILTFYGIAGTIVDKASGANRSLSPNPVTVQLVPVEEGGEP